MGICIQITYIKHLVLKRKNIIIKSFFMKNTYFKSISVLTFILLFACEKPNTDTEDNNKPVSGALVINEAASSSDFVEIYNGTSQSLDLSGYVINDSDTYDEDAYLFPEGSSIESGGFIAVYKDVDFLFGISGNGETLYLLDASGVIVNEMELPEEVEGYDSYGREVDGGETFKWFELRTDGKSNSSIPDDNGGDENLYPDWSDATHSNDVAPNFDIVFNQNEVLRLDIVISAEDWDAMWDDLAQNIRGGMTGMSSDYTPIWVRSTITYNDIDWYNVGIRFKGNSSLSSSYQSDIDKLSLKLDFDEWEDDYPALKNQRFYGFKQLNLNNNYQDMSFMREKTASDLFRDFGLAAAHTSYCEVYINSGSESVYYGLYTIVEEVDDTVIETQFSSDSGNLYKPDGDAASFGLGTFDTEEFYPKTNEDVTDYSDLRALYDALHSDLRGSDLEAWKDNLEGIFDVDTFLKWLAVTTTIQNWDSYGVMTHNYYIYNNPENNLLTWIPWDHNEAFSSGHGSRQAYDPDELSRVSSNWPLISFLINVEEYQNIYKDHLRDFTENHFNHLQMTAKYDSYFNLVKESAYSEGGNRTFLRNDADFDRAVDELKSHVVERINEVESYL